MSVESSPTYLTSEACEIAGITYRQFGYWLHKGLLPGLEGAGSGNALVMTKAQVEHLTLMSTLSQSPEKASELATRLLTGKGYAISECATLLVRREGGV